MVNTIADSGRGRVVAVLAAIAVVAVGLAAGLVYLIVSSARQPPAKARPAAAASASASASMPARVAPSAGSTGIPLGGSTSDREDALANEPMLSLPQSDAQPQPMVTASAGAPIHVPAPTNPASVGGAPVPTGFPQTPEGALGQLKAIDEVALSTTDPAKVREVYSWAAEPDAPAESDWNPAAIITELAKGFGDSNGQASATFQVEEGQIKGTVGPDFVLGCVLGEWDVTLSQLARYGVGDCQRMVWSQGRWWIGSGSQPVAPSPVWPNSLDSVRAGWRVLTDAP